MERIKLTAENVKDASEFVDGDGDTCRRDGGLWSWFDAPGMWADRDIARDVRRGDIKDAYVTKWLPGRGPTATAPAPQHEPLSRDDVRAILKMYRRDAITMDAALDAICGKVQP